MNYNKHATVEVGSEIRCLKNKVFSDGTRHQKNDVFLVTKETLSYFKLHTDNREYEVWA